MSGSELRRRREALGLTQRALARRLGIHHNSVWEWEARGVPAGRVELVNLALQALESQPPLAVYRRADPRPLGKAWANAHGSHWDDALIVVHADTLGQARAGIASELNVAFLEAKVRRLPAMDDLPITGWNLLVTGSCGWSECDGCYRKIYPDGHAINGPWSCDEDDVEVAAVQGPHGTAYCSAACLARHLAPKEQTA